MFSNRHHPSDEQILSVVDREGLGTRTAGTEAHLEECRPCAARAATFRSALASLREARDTSPFHTSADLADARRRLVKGLSGDAALPLPPSTIAGRRGERSWWRLASAAVVVIGVAVGVWVAAGQYWRDLGHRGRAGAGGPLPIAALTPGATRDVPVPVLCAGGVDEARPIPSNMRAQVLRAYRMEHVPADEFELDYLITPELGGATAAANLWPERYGSHAWNARVKDQLETLLPSLVCRGDVDLKAAQREIAANWIAAYQHYFKTDRPIQSAADARIFGVALTGARFRLIWFVPIR